MALNIRACGYNVYVSGDANLGRSYTLLSYLGPQARKRPTPPDLVYVHNFDDPDRPRLLSLPAASKPRPSSSSVPGWWTASRRSAAAC